MVCGGGKVTDGWVVPVPPSLLLSSEQACLHIESGNLHHLLALPRLEFAFGLPRGTRGLLLRAVLRALTNLILAIITFVVSLARLGFLVPAITATASAVAVIFLAFSSS